MRSEQSKERNKLYMEEYNKSRPPDDWNTYLIKKHEYRPETLQAAEVCYDTLLEELELEKEDE